MVLFIVKRCYFEGKAKKLTQCLQRPHEKHMTKLKEKEVCRQRPATCFTHVE
jgi:hypothetical protein